MKTISGQDVRVKGLEAPTLYDIGYALSWQPRFGGHIVRRWTVLHHLYACRKYASLTGYSASIQLYAFLHDGHEAIIGDIPFPWKTEDMRQRQNDLDARLYGSLKLSTPDLETTRIIERIDAQMGYAEAKVFAPCVAEAMLIPGENFKDGINPWDEDANVAVEFVEEELLDVGPVECGLVYEDDVKTLIQLAKENIYAYR